MKTLNEIIIELQELQNQGKGEYSVIDANGDCTLCINVLENYKEIMFGE